MAMKKSETGCDGCDFLKWYEAYFEEPCESGWYCEIREIPAKSFPLKRKCKRWQRTRTIDGKKITIRLEKVAD